MLRTVFGQVRARFGNFGLATPGTSQPGFGQAGTGNVSQVKFGQVRQRQVRPGQVRLWQDSISKIVKVMIYFYSV
jgi:hypothetical protein